VIPTGSRKVAVAGGCNDYLIVLRQRVRHVEFFEASCNLTVYTDKAAKWVVEIEVEV